MSKILKNKSPEFLNSLCENLGDDILKELLNSSIYKSEWEIIEAFAHSDRCVAVIDDLNKKHSPMSGKVYHPQLLMTEQILQSISSAFKGESVTVKNGSTRSGDIRYNERKELPKVAYEACKTILQRQKEAFDQLMIPKINEDLKDIAIKLAGCFNNLEIIQSVGLDIKKLPDIRDRNPWLELIGSGGSSSLKNLPDGYLDGQIDITELRGNLKNKTPLTKDEWGDLMRTVMPVAPADGPAYTKSSLKSYAKAHKALLSQAINDEQVQFLQENPRYLSLHQQDAQKPTQEVIGLITAWAQAGILHLCGPEVKAHVANSIAIKPNEDGPGYQLADNTLKNYLLGYTSNGKSQVPCVDPDQTLVSVLKHHPEAEKFLDVSVTIRNPFSARDEQKHLVQWAVEQKWTKSLLAFADIGLDSAKLHEHVPEKDRNDYFTSVVAMLQSRKAQEFARSALADMGLGARP